MKIKCGFALAAGKFYLLNKNHVSAVDTSYGGSTGAIYKSESVDQIDRTVPAKAGTGNFIHTSTAVQNTHLINIRLYKDTNRNLRNVSKVRMIILYVTEGRNLMLCKIYNGLKTNNRVHK